jgi:DNA-binding Lrp family transcriptional regulator
MDRIDRNIIATVQSNARISNQDLSEAVNLSPSPCLKRFRRLEEQGVVGPYLTRVNLDKVCRSVTVFATISLRSHELDDFRMLESVVRDTPEVVECYKVSGMFDYLAKFVCPDIARYHALSDELLRKGEGLLRLSSHVVLSNTKEFVGYPLKQLLDE